MCVGMYVCVCVRCAGRTPAHLSTFDCGGGGVEGENYEAERVRSLVTARPETTTAPATALFSFPSSIEQWSTRSPTAADATTSV